jgi:hypothetical protein
MPGLSELQAAFRRHVMSNHPGIEHYIDVSRGPGRDQRLAIYAHAYRARLVEALGTDYAVLKAVLGEEPFRELCHSYLQASPSTHYSLRWFGRRLPAFLRRNGRGHLAELAAFEWKLAAAFDARDAPVVAPQAAGAIPAPDWPAVRLRLHPSVRTQMLSWNTLNIWRSVKAAHPVPAHRTLARPGSCLIWRDGLVTRYRSLQADERAALGAVASGATFAALCEGLAASGIPAGSLALRAAGFLKTWLSHGLVSELTT